MKNKKLLAVNSDSLDKSNVFVEVHSAGWKHPNKMSLDELSSNVKNKKFNLSKEIDNDTLIIDPDTLKITVNSSYINTSNVFSEPFDNHNISFNQPPKNASAVSGVHLVADSNYLYVWIENRWKRIPLAEW